MVKTKENDDNSTDSGDERDRNDDNLKSPSSSKCSHINKSIVVTKIKKIIKNGLLTSCSECEKENLIIQNNNNKDEDEYEYDRTLWLCLKCGVQLCGRAKNKHALQHYEVRH